MTTSERGMTMSGMTSERLEELRRIAEAATPGPWTSPWEQKDGLDPEEYGFYGASGDKIVGLLWCDGWHLECSEENARHIATFDPPTVLALLDEIERLRQTVDALQLDRRDLKDVISVLEQEQRRAGRYLEDARDELAHGRIQSAEHRIIDALVSLSSKERRTDTRLKTAVKSGGGCD